MTTVVIYYARLGCVFSERAYKVGRSRQTQLKVIKDRFSWII